MDLEGGHNDYILNEKRIEQERKERQITFKKILN